MSEQNEPNVGMRLRSIRDKHGLSLRTLAERCGLSINAISLIERGENSPTVSTLHRLASALEVAITDFFQDEVKQTAVFVKRDLGLRYQRDGVVMESLGIGLSNQQLEPFLMKIDTEITNLDDPITHPGEEFIHCLEGEVTYFVGDNVFQLEQGDSLLFTADQPHGYRKSTREPVSLLMVFQASQDNQRLQQIHLVS